MDAEQSFFQMRTYKPDQFEFAIMYADDHDEIFIVFEPNKETGLSSDQHIGELTTFLTKNGPFSCAMECEYSFEGTVGEARRLLEKLGFSYSHELEDCLAEGAYQKVEDPTKIFGNDDWNNFQSELGRESPEY